VLIFAGFRTTLIFACVTGAILTFVNGLFTPATPYLVMAFVLLLAGFARSFFFTSINALSFADIPNSDAGQATAMSAVLQQMSLAFGVAIAGATLEIETALTGSKLELGDFHIAFMLISAITLSAIIPLIGMSKTAGASVSGHRMRQQPEAETIVVK
jgi:MFS family permease